MIPLPPGAASALLAMSSATDRRTALLWAMEAVLRGCPAATAHEAFETWQAAADAAVRTIEVAS